MQAHDFKDIITARREPIGQQCECNARSRFIMRTAVTIILISVMLNSEIHASELAYKRNWCISWQNNDFACIRTPKIIKGVLYFLSSGTNIVGIETDSGKVVLNKAFPTGEKSEIIDFWIYNDGMAIYTGDTITSFKRGVEACSKMIGGRTRSRLFLSGDSSVYCLEALEDSSQTYSIVALALDNCKVKWSYRIDDGREGQSGAEAVSFGMDNRYIYVVTKGGELIKLSKVSGSEVWRRIIGRKNGRLYGVFVPEGRDDDSLFVFGNTEEKITAISCRTVSWLYKLRRDSGEKIWNTEGRNRIVDIKMAGLDRLVVVSLTNITLISSENAERIWRYVERPLRMYKRNSVVVEDGELYVFTHTDRGADGEEFMRTRLRAIGLDNGKYKDRSLEGFHGSLFEGKGNVLYVEEGCRHRKNYLGAVKSCRGKCKDCIVMPHIIEESRD